MAKAKALRGLVLTMGYACLAIGLGHVLLGNAVVPGAEDAGPTMDSLGRFFGAVFAGYGLAWLLAARRSPIPASAVRWLTAVFLLGAVGRLLSLAAEGRPHVFQLVLTGIELALPPVLFLLADADEKAAAGAARVTGAAPAQAR
ncbi:DUF4345 domain-containing protein [Streptomyces zhihengii]|uniref:DUF4345 domain-containing protein n=1 Tax=Streptomyces zhihengii TaxID=1818004 RepID=A0ABS2UVY8_9ACTN|nr:DUF4345 domain-containing protein [Streptomyces zhihengii]MBM9621213.1 DUF4345 domain-containing protein [Streptomyces zhihengii]